MQKRESFDSNLNERRALRRVAPRGEVFASIESESGRRLLGKFPVGDFSGLGASLLDAGSLRAHPTGEKLWVTLVAEEGIIPLRARLVHQAAGGWAGVDFEAPHEAGQNFLLRLYQRAAADAHAEQTSAC